ncbi:hypothetical protein BT69DRAFT_1262422 [Atractiella rhizophila]|nr:hypothetical protein BT69DRAFT_1272326 [Atractiella rhizophila]KAH8923417.1 hypothetical protein BT69DRAFT_1262422 [Atractiella rhizophila]
MSKHTSALRQDEEFERQNEERLQSLHSKIKTLRSVTIDIHSDSQSQNALLDTTSNTFDRFTSALQNTSTRLTRSVNGKHSQTKIVLYIAAGFLVLWILYRWFV